MSNAEVIPMPETKTSTRERLCQLRDALSATFAERGNLAEAVMLAIVAKQHVCVVGPPGAAKSALLLSLQTAINGGRFFDTLMSRFSVEEDVFGPRSLTAMKADRWERVLGGYLADSEFAFLDEVFKANGSILNALLRILNERTYQGAPRPLWTVVAASNELQEDESLDALWDRFMLRLDVSWVKSEDTFRRLISRRPPKFSTPCTVSMDEIRVAHDEAMAISPVLPDAVVTELCRLRKALADAGIHASDRRWMAIGDLLRAAAWLDGSSAVEIDHLAVLRFALWSKLDELPRVKAALDSIDTGVVGEVTKVIDDALRAWESRPSEPVAYRDAQTGLCNTIEEARRKVDAVLAGSVTKRARERIQRKRGALDSAWDQLRADLASRLGFKR